MDTTCASVGRHPESTKDWSESPGAMRCARQKNRSPSVSSSKLSQYAGMAGWFSALSVMASRSNSSSAFQLFMFRKLSTFSAMSSPSSVVALYVVPKLPDPRASRMTYEPTPSCVTVWSTVKTP